MAGRPIGRRHQEDVRRKIKASQLINALTKHVLGEKLLKEQSQVTAALGLLKKVVPDLASVEHSGELTSNVKLVKERDAKRVA